MGRTVYGVADGSSEPDTDGAALVDGDSENEADGFGEGDATSRLGIPASESAKISTKIAKTAMTQGAASVSRPAGSAPR